MTDRYILILFLLYIRHSGSSQWIVFVKSKQVLEIMLKLCHVRSFPCSVADGQIDCGQINLSVCLSVCLSLSLSASLCLSASPCLRGCSGRGGQWSSGKMLDCCSEDLGFTTRCCWAVVRQQSSCCVEAWATSSTPHCLRLSEETI